jgi:hypothetical protein
MIKLNPRLNTKSTNPKDSIGVRKPRCYHVLSAPVVREVSIGMMEGAMKYGAYNYRVAGVRASVYVDATKEHIDSWWEGQDIDPDSKLNHITKAIASLCVLRDAMIQGRWVDDRPPVFIDVQDHKNEMQAVVDSLFEKYPNPVAPYTEKEVNDKSQDQKPEPLQAKK